MVNIVKALPRANERSRLRVKDDESVVALVRRQVPLVAQAELKCEIRSQFVVGLDEEAKSSLRDAARLLAERHAEGIGGFGGECGDAGKVECGCALSGIIVQGLSKLAPDFGRMPAAHGGRDGAWHNGCVATPRRGGRWAAEVKGATGDADLRQSDGLGNTPSDSEIGGVE